MDKTKLAATALLMLLASTTLACEREGQPLTFLSVQDCEAYVANQGVQANCLLVGEEVSSCSKVQEGRYIYDTMPFEASVDLKRWNCYYGTEAPLQTQD